MINEKFAFREQQLLLLKKLYPQYVRVIDCALEDLEDVDALVGRSDYNRIFRAIAEGYHLRAEISKRTGIDKDELKILLGLMLKAGVLRTEEQGGKTEGARGARKILFFRVERLVVKDAPAAT